MSEAQGILFHTPGPWRVEGEGYSATVFEPGGLLAQVTGDAVTRPANARLIAAAPELLEALLCVLTALGVENPEDDAVLAYRPLWLDSVRAAISKATNQV